MVSLDPLICPCSTMFRINAAHLAWTLEGLVEGKVRNRITVVPETAADAPHRPRPDAEHHLAVSAHTELGGAGGYDRRARYSSRRGFL